jgi:hypothetical protein
MIFGKSDPKVPHGKPAAEAAPMPSAASAPTTAAAPIAVARPASSTAASSEPAPAAQTRSSSAQSRERQAATIRYVDRADIAETFADSVSGLVFDGQTLRIEFAVTRLDEVKPNTPITGRRYPTCRLVLPPAAAVELINRMQQIGAALTQTGAARTAARPGEVPQAS